MRFALGGIERGMESQNSRSESLRSLSRSLVGKEMDLELLDMALTHSSYANEPGRGTPSNERLEYLGDAVLNLAIADFLFRSRPDEAEGTLARMRADTVSEPALAEVGRGLDLGTYLRLGRGEEKTGGRERDSILSDAVEAVVGAVFLDLRWEAARAFVVKMLSPHVESGLDGCLHNSKGLLQEILQEQYRALPTYHCSRIEGPDHLPTFESEVRLRDKVLACGKGRTKKEAEQEAARRAIMALRAGTCV